jgi:hypothetical protein
MIAKKGREEVVLSTHRRIRTEVVEELLLIELVLSTIEA